jgi:hypothetical protein
VAIAIAIAEPRIDHLVKTIQRIQFGFAHHNSLRVIWRVHQEFSIFVKASSRDACKEMRHYRFFLLLTLTGLPFRHPTKLRFAN